MDKNGKILYIGKAKDLKKRVSSYFNKVHDNVRTNMLVKRIVDIRTIVTETEFDALLLENNLIKEHQPKYNVNLKDDKTYPWICIKREPFPRIFSTRQKINDGSEYYGPYASVRVMNTILDLIRQLYTLRTCSLPLNPKSIEEGKFKVCLEYHIHNCKGPCEGFQSEAEYLQDVAAARYIIKGNLKEVKRILRSQMEEYASNLQFELAQKTKENLHALETYQSKSTVVHPDISNVDVFSIISDAEYAYVNFLKIIEGAVIQAHTVEMKKKLDETDEELLGLALLEMRTLFESDSPEIYVSHHPDIEIPNTKVILPQRGDKKQLIELSMRNARYFRMEKLKNMQMIDPDRHVNRLMQQMKHDLRMPVEPRHLECFDNSNIQGTNPVSACVVFKDGKPSKKDYRHFNVKTVEGPDDFATMEEVILRRYKRLIEENQPLPQLIVIDGGKGQLGAALKSLEKLGLRGKITIVGIAKRLEEIYFPGDSTPLYLDKRSETLKVIQQARNEAHRFGITHHRDRRSKSTIKSELGEIPGIGPSTMQTLLKHFKSVRGVKDAHQEELTKIVGKSKAQKIISYFHNSEE